MIVEATKLQEAIQQALREVNDSCLALRAEGVTVLLPESIDFEVRMVTNSDINAVQRAVTEAEADGGQTVTTRSQLSPDTELSKKSGEKFQTARTGSAGSERTEISHPSVTTQQGGSDNSEENVTYTYE